MKALRKPIGESYVVLEGSQRHLLSGSRATGAANPYEHVEITVKIRGKNPLPALDSRPSALLSYEELEATYGATPADVKLVANTLGVHGLRVFRSDPGARSLHLSGTVRQMENAFQVRLMHYTHESGDYRGRTGYVHIPASLKGVVTGVFGLDARRMINKKKPPTVRRDVNEMLAVNRAWYFPGELADHYQFPEGDGTGQTIGILEFDGGYFSADMEKFCSLAKVPMPKVIPISVDHTSTTVKNDADVEVMMDVEIVGGICPKATIPVYFGKFTERGWVNILDTAIHDKVNMPSVLSVSYGLAEGQNVWTSTAMTAVNEAFTKAALLGITICISSGDDGSDAQVGDGYAHVSFPASSPYVLAVGGTNLSRTNGAFTEVVWKDGDGLRADGGGATGGGVSVAFGRPSWQSAITIPSVNPGAKPGRIVPDVAAHAETDGNSTGYFIVVDGQSARNGGTSAAAPLWASLIGRFNEQLGVGQRVGYLTPLLYQSAGRANGSVGKAGCNDITTGNNVSAAIGGYYAGSGYDATTGWGSPNGVELLAALKPVIGKTVPAKLRAGAAVKGRGSVAGASVAGGSAAGASGAGGSVTGGSVVGAPVSTFNSAAMKASSSNFDAGLFRILYDPEHSGEDRQSFGMEAIPENPEDALPTAVPWPENLIPKAAPLQKAPTDSDDLSVFKGYDAIVVTWTAAEAATLARLFTPGYPVSSWYEYRHDVDAYIPLVTGNKAPFNDANPKYARTYHSMGLYFPCTIGKAKVLLFKSGLHLDYDGPATPLKKLMAELYQAVKPQVFITTGTGGAIGKDVKLGDVVIAPHVRFDCVKQFSTDSFHASEFTTSALPAKALAAITPELTKVNAARIKGARKEPKFWTDAESTIVTTDFFAFDDSENTYKLEGLGRVCDMGDAMVANALQPLGNLKFYAIRNASDPQIPNPDGDIKAAGKDSNAIYAKYGGLTTAASVIATWAVITAKFG